MQAYMPYLFYPMFYPTKNNVLPDIDYDTTDL